MRAAGAAGAVAAALLLASLLPAACSPRDEQIVVSVAASLTEVVADLAAAAPELGIVANAAGSQALASQILAGAPADVFLSANAEQMAVVVEAGLAEGTPVTFASNRLVLVVAEGNPAAVHDVEDLRRGGLVVVLADPAVPLGGYSAELLRAAGLADEVVPASLELSARDLVGRIVAGDADVGLAYATDVAVIDGVEAIDVPPSLQPRIDYVGVALTARGEAFMALLCGPSGAEVLSDRGFLLP